VAFIVFNRPATTERVFAEIRRARPSQLLVVADGPRDGRPAESVLCEQTRAIVEHVDWPCEVLRNYAEVNLGCRARVASGLDWVFQTVPEAVVLEDDCLPDQSFFAFCRELLARFRETPEVMCVSGENSQSGRKRGNFSYYFSRYPRVWGWASWRRAWQHYDVDLRAWSALRNRNVYLEQFENADERAYWRHNWDLVAKGSIDTWDYQWAFACLAQQGLTAVPNCNLISNIGMGSSATHTTEVSHLSALPLEQIAFPLMHPPALVRDVGADEFTRANLLRYPGLRWKIEQRLRSVPLAKHLHLRQAG
jgi:hypothetical protein